MASALSSWYTPIKWRTWKSRGSAVAISTSLATAARIWAHKRRRRQAELNRTQPTPYEGTSQTHRTHPTP
eukprot:379803-Prymnesium_polylepis.2